MTLQDSAHDQQHWRRTVARRNSEDILDRLTFAPRPGQPPVLTEEQAAAGRLLRMHHADAQAAVRTSWEALEGRVDVSPGPTWEPDGGGGSLVSEYWLRRMVRDLGRIDCEIVTAIAVKRHEPRQVYVMLMGRGFIYSRREVTTHIRRAFEALRRFCDGV